MKQVILLITFIFLLLGLSQISSGQKMGIYIFDSQHKTPVPYATIQNEAAKILESADEYGFIQLPKPSDENLEVIISCMGYESQKINLSRLDFSGINPVVYLDQKTITLSEVTLSGGFKNGIYKNITDLDIHLRPITNSQEVLRMVPGLFIGQHAGGGKAEQIFLRGFDLDHGTDINITVDGIPVNMVSHAHGQGYADLHFLIPELIGKVNFNKGPYYADKGNFTTAGYVDFKTKDFLENSFLKMEAGQFGTFRGIAGLNLITPSEDQRTQSLYIAAEGSLTKGYFESAQDFNRYNGILKYRGAINDKNTLKTTITGFSSQWNASGQIPVRAIESGLIGIFGAIDDTEGGITSRYNANAELLSFLPNGSSLSNQIFYSKYKFELYSNFTFFKEDPINGDQIKQKENRDILGYNSTYIQEYKIGRFDTETKAGIQLRYDQIKDIELSRTINRVEISERIMLGDVNEFNAGIYYSQKISLTDRFEITGALRYDVFYNRYNDRLISTVSESNSGILSPKLNFNYRLSDNIQLYLYNGRGFHSNDTRVAVPQNGKQVLPPAYGTDLGGIFKIGKKLLLQTDVWHLWLDQEFIYVGDEGVVEAGGQSQRYGLDVSARFELFKNLFADIDLSLANPRAVGEPKNENFIPLAPMFSSVGGITYKKSSGLNGSLRYRYIADRPANEDFSVTAKGYFVADAVLNYTRRNWEIGLSIQNIFNSKWKETQFETESQLLNESIPVSEIHFTPGSPFFARLHVAVFF